MSDPIKKLLLKFKIIIFIFLFISELSFQRKVFKIGGYRLSIVFHQRITFNVVYQRVVYVDSNVFYNIGSNVFYNIVPNIIYRRVINQSETRKSENPIWNQPIRIGFHVGCDDENWRKTTNAKLMMRLG